LYNDTQKEILTTLKTKKLIRKVGFEEGSVVRELPDSNRSSVVPLKEESEENIRPSRPMKDTHVGKQLSAQGKYFR
jgi:hypothetical protein